VKAILKAQRLERLQKRLKERPLPPPRARIEVVHLPTGQKRLSNYFALSQAREYCHEVGGMMPELRFRLVLD
jgi:hypothetical protein